MDRRLFGYSTLTTYGRSIILYFVLGSVMELVWVGLGWIIKRYGQEPGLGAE